MVLMTMMTTTIIELKFETSSFLKPRNTPAGITQ